RASTPAAVYSAVICGGWPRGPMVARQRDTRRCLPTSFTAAERMAFAVGCRNSTLFTSDILVKSRSVSALKAPDFNAGFVCDAVAAAAGARGCIFDPAGHHFACS